MRKYAVIGETFGEWTVISEKTEKYKRWYKLHVKCKCGKEDYVAASSLRGGKSTCCKTCGWEKHYKGIGNLSSTFFSRILEGARVRGIEVSITKEEILNLLEKQKYKCALSGLHLTLSKTFSTDRSNRTYFTTASLDRIDSSKGYIEGNVQWIHKDINIMKNKFPNDYFIDMCKKISKNNSKKKIIAK